MALPEEGTIQQRILIAMDGSRISEDAFKWYASKIRQDRDYVVVVYIPEFRSIKHISVMAADTALVQKIVEDERQTTDVLLTKLRELMETFKVQGEVLQSFGEPGQQIIEVANETGANVIITGSRGHGTLRRTFLGSVTDYVLHHAHIPVLVYKPEHKH